MSKVKNIGYVLYDYPVKSETWIPLEIEELVMRGYNVKVHRLQYPYVDISDCDFVLSHFAHIALEASKFGKPFGFVAHAWDIWTDNGKKFKQVIKSPNCKFVGYISEYHKKKFLEWGVPKEKLMFWGASVDVDRLERKYTMGGKIICGGRFIEKKGLDIAIKAVPNITVFGDGELAPKLKAISTKAQFVGWLERDEMKKLMEKSYLLIAPSRVARNGDTEGISTLVLEALCMGLQVITTKVAGHGDLEQFGDRVHFVEIDDVDAIRELVYSLPHSYSALPKHIIEQTRSPKAIVDNIERKIQEVMA
jgi:glycosyltransferase involved in cell wall biosynthesis